MKVTQEEVQILVRVQLGIKKLSMESLFMEDLGAESADLVNIAAAAQDKFSVSFDETDIAGVRNVEQLYLLIKKLQQPKG